MTVLTAAVLLLLGLQEGKKAVYPETVRNTQKPGENPPPASKALEGMTVPDGFRVSLFAHEPDVAQPISMAFDGRGRLWVAEGYTYNGSKGAWNQPAHDRIVIFEDADHDGRFDRRKVFLENVRNLTGVLPGFGGVYVLSAPELLFVPDRDRDDRPDGKAEVVLDGWDIRKSGHNIVNGMIWGPDGWIWGCHGIMGESRVGPPGTPVEERPPMNCGIWRVHPTRKVFEIVCHGTTNPWGLDFDDHGQAFFTNCVIGHLWHAIPGARYERMYGQDYMTYAYGLIRSCSDHIHWGGGPWQKSRSGKAHDKPGGGHSHVGAMVYLGDNWPETYRGNLFTCNVHGRRVNQDILERRGSGYVGRHGRDFLLAEDRWFRGISVLTGPDGGVFVSDWSEDGECHDNDGVHRKSGRIYKVVYGTPARPTALGVDTLDDLALVRLQLHRNDWYVRQARRVLQERAAEGRKMTGVHEALREIFTRNPDVTRKLRALWAAYVTGGLADGDLVRILGHAEEHVRSWAVRLIVDDGSVPDDARRKFAAMAKEDGSPRVRLSLASAMQKLSLDQRWPIAEGLAGHADDAEDPNLPLMIWYGIEPLVKRDPARALKLAKGSKIPLLRQHIARRIARD